MEKIIGIYKIENIVNGKVYIGQSKNVYNRFRSHIKYETKSHLCKSIKKYGENNFKLFILERFSFYGKDIFKKLKNS